MNGKNLSISPSSSYTTPPPTTTFTVATGGSPSLQMSRGDLPSDPFQLLSTWMSPFNMLGIGSPGGGTIPTQSFPQIGMMDMANLLSQPYTLIQATIPLIPLNRPDSNTNTITNTRYRTEASGSRQENQKGAGVLNDTNYRVNDSSPLNAANANANANNGATRRKLNVTISPKDINKFDTNIPNTNTPVIISDNSEGQGSMQSSSAFAANASSLPALSSGNVCPTCAEGFVDLKLAVFCNECHRWIHKKCCRKHFIEEDNEIEEDDEEKEAGTRGGERDGRIRPSLKRKHEQDDKQGPRKDGRQAYPRRRRRRRRRGNKSGCYTENEYDDGNNEREKDEYSESSSEDEADAMGPGSPPRPMLSPILSSSASPSPPLGPLSVSPLSPKVYSAKTGPADFTSSSSSSSSSSGVSSNSGGGWGGSFSAFSKSGVLSNSAAFTSSGGMAGAEAGAVGTVITFNKVNISQLACEICTVCGAGGTLYQDIISCADCGQSFHTACIHYAGPLFYGYTWRCPKCALCEKCGRHCNPGNSVACATCARLYHASCIAVSPVPWFWECDGCKMLRFLRQGSRRPTTSSPVGTPPVESFGSSDNEYPGEDNDDDDNDDDDDDDDDYSDYRNVEKDYDDEEEMVLEEEEFEERSEPVPSPSDTRECVICKGRECAEDRLLPVECDVWVHTRCAFFSSGVSVSSTNEIWDLKEAISGGKTGRCSLCGKTGGVTVSCSAPKCTKRYHPKCALESGGAAFAYKRDRKMDLHTFLCAAHKAKSAEMGMVGVPTVARSRGPPRVVVTQRKSTRRLPVRLGNFSLISHGARPWCHTKNGSCIDTYEHPVYPVGWKSTLLFWDHKNPKEKCLYRCETGQCGNISTKDDTSKKLIARVTTVRGGRDCETFVGNSTSEVWCKIIELINAARNPARIHFKGGDFYFGLTNPLALEIMNEEKVNLRAGDQMEPYHIFMNSCRRKGTVLHREHCAREGGTKLWRVGRGCKLVALRNKYNSRKKGRGHQSAPLSSAGPSSSLNQSSNRMLVIPFHDTSESPLRGRYNLMLQQEGNFDIKKSPIQGMGIFSPNDFPPDSMLFEYKGEIIRLSVADIREEKYQKECIGYYMFSFPNGDIIDATFSGSFSRFINHSHNPNCKAEIIEVYGQHHIVIITKAHVEQGDELSYDYKFENYDDSEKIKCNCCSVNCPGYIN